MSYRSILVELATERSVAANLPVAHRLAERFDATCVAMHVTPEPFVPVPWEGGGSVYIQPSLMDAQRQAARAARDRVEAAFRQALGRETRITWSEAEGDAERLLVTAALSVDLVVATQGQSGSPETPDMADRLITAIGVPLLMVPPAAPADLGETVLVGWNGSREAARAVHEALPFLVRATRVLMCAVGDTGAASFEAAVGMLRRHGVPVEPLTRNDRDSAAGEALLASAQEQRADLLVMGSFGRPRLRELIFGGATHHMLREARLPVLFGS
jgi:nucleotide-binding universal stress UspA family protein